VEGQRVERGADFCHLLTGAGIVAFAVGGETVGMQDQGCGASAPHGTKRLAGSLLNGQDIARGCLPRLDSKSPKARRDGTRHRQFERRGLSNLVVFENVKHRELPQAGEIQAFVERALTKRTIADKSQDDIAGFLGFFGQGHARRDGGEATLDAVGVKIAPLNVLAAAAPANQAGGLAHQFGGEAIGVAAIGKEMPMTAMIAPDDVIRVSNRKYPGCIGFLTDIGMGGAKQLAGGKLGQRALLEAADGEHGFVELVVFGHRMNYIKPQKVPRFLQDGIISLRMSPETPTSTTKICPTCGTRLAKNATRCLVCGTELSPTVEPKKMAAVSASRMPEVTLSLPMALGLLVLLLVIGAALVFAVMRITGGAGLPAAQANGPTPTITPSPTVTFTPTTAMTNTPVPTDTPLPPFEYTVGSGDTCTSIAVQFGVSINSILILNNLSTSCILAVGQKIKVPYPTPTPPPAATSTPEAAQATLQACEKVVITVQENDTLSSIAANYNVPGDAIKSYNSLSTDTVFLGMKLIIPLCERAPTPGPSPTATIPPPYPAVNLLLPPDGASFTLANDSITLQWASIGTLRDNEAYIVIIEDVTEGEGRRLVDYVKDTKYMVPVSFRPKDARPHIFRWWIGTVRQAGSDDQGQPLWDSAGANSLQRVFSWQGVAPEETPQP